MLVLAIKMLTGNTGKYLGLIAGIFFSALIITQQSSIFVGLMSRTYGFLTDTQYADIWVADSKIQYLDDPKPLQDTRLTQVRGIPGVAWAVPLYRGNIKARLSNGQFQNCTVVGLDDATLIGGPPVLVEGRLADLRQADAVIVDEAAAKGRLAKILPDGSREPLKVGDTLELNDKRGVIVGIARTTRAFNSQSLLYTTYSRAIAFAPRERRLLSFILVEAKPGIALADLTKTITARTGLAAYTVDEFSMVSVKYFLKNTGIPINFGIAVTLGFIVGCAIAAQTLYGFVLDNLKYFGTLKAMGATNWLLLKMITVQTSVVGFIGYGLGVGVASMTSILSKNSELAFRMPWQLLLVSAAAVFLICFFSGLICAIKVMRVDPAIVFKS